MDWRIDVNWKKNERASADNGNIKGNKLGKRVKNNILKKIAGTEKINAPSMEDCQHYLGMSRQQLVMKLDTPLKYYLSNRWEFHLKTNRIGQKTILVIHFKNNQVCKIRTKKTFGKL